eukprot:725325-Heterocapsa_arctica.AAC.1
MLLGVYGKRLGQASCARRSNGWGKPTSINHLNHSWALAKGEHPTGWIPKYDRTPYGRAFINTPTNYCCRKCIEIKAPLLHSFRNRCSHTGFNVEVGPARRAGGERTSRTRPQCA